MRRSGGWTIQDLGALEGASSTATALNERGQVTGISGKHAFVWTGGKLKDLGPATAAVAINIRGQVALTRSIPGSYGAHHAFLWTQGKVQDLGTLGHDAGGDMPNTSEPVGVDDRGEVLVESSINQNEPVSWAFVWRKGKKVVLSSAGDYDRQSFGAGINKRGEVAGWIGSDQVYVNHGQAFRWAGGKLSRLGTLGKRRFSEALGMNDRGSVVGDSYDGGDGPQHLRAFLWRSGKMHDLGTLPRMNESTALAINDGGAIVGVSSNENADRVFLWRSGKMRDLGPLPLDAGTVSINARGYVLAAPRVWWKGKFLKLPTLGGKQSAAMAINDRGQIAGWSTTKAGRKHAALWSLR